MKNRSPDIGIAIASHQSEDVIGACLTSLLESRGADLQVVVVDNESSDTTCEVIRSWALQHSGQVTFEERALGEIEQSDAWLTLLRSPINGGFARATNAALRTLLETSSLDLFWVLNPDCVVTPGAAASLSRAAKLGPFSLMGGRTLFAGTDGIIQTDGGRVSRLTGRCISVNRGLATDAIGQPDADSLDYITGANCVASRAFIERAGLIPEEYFLYYEEVDWAMRRADLPLRIVSDAIVYHIGGTAIGTARMDRIASPFSMYFNFRNRARFMARWNKWAVPITLAFGFAEYLRLFAQGHLAEARALLAGLLQRPPPQSVRAKLSRKASAIAFEESNR